MGLMGSAFGRALSGAGQAAANLAGKYIDEEIQQNRMQAMADIQRQSATHQRNDQFAFDNAPGNVATRNATAKTTALAAGETAREVETARLSDPALNEAARSKAAADAQTAAKIKNDQTMAEAGDDKLLAARAKIELADPKVAQQLEVMKAQIRSSNASAGAAAANARQSNAQTAGIELNNADKKRLGALYDQAETILTDETITDPKVRAEKMAKVLQQAELIKAKNGTGGAARNPELDTVTIEEIDPATGAKTTRKEVRRPGAAGAGGADPYADIAAALEKNAGKKSSKPDGAEKPLVEAARARASADPITTMSDSDLRRVASIEGHANQAKAQAELERRAKSSPEVDTTAYGFGGR